MDSTNINNKKIMVGEKSVIDPTAEIIILNGGSITIGDYCYIGKQVKIICDGTSIVIDDWTSIHDRSLLMAQKELRIGQHCWFGQSTVLDATAGLVIGNSVRVGMFSQVWSHVSAGEQIDGCQLLGFRPVVIDDGAWLVGTVYVCPGVRIGTKSIVLIGSVVTKNVSPLSVGGGNPYKIRDRISYYKDINEKERWDLMVQWSTDDGLNFEVEVDEKCIVFKSNDLDGQIILYRYLSDFEAALETNNPNTLCSLEGKYYRKKYSDIEKSFIKSFSSNKIRFLEYRQ